MKTSVVKIFAGSGIRLAVLSFLLLGMAGACMAQASAAPARPAAQAAVAPQAQPVAPPAQTGAPTAKGTSEGIKVHGHWTIEVKNPDGKLVSHTEFENSLYNFDGISGAQLLAALLDRWVSAGGWFVVVSNASGGNTSILLDEAGLEPAGNCAEYASNPTINCTYGLTISGPTLLLQAIVGPGTLTLTGSGMWPSGAGAASTIGYVQTGNFPCSGGVYCYNTASNLYTPVPFTQRTLDGLNGDPAAVSVTGGQTVNVTVVISFQ
jgi:hypothetical protein